eukprot:scaffold1012_cov418-Prasinococcus_capsulatus_cf.AAC.13
MSSHRHRGDQSHSGCCFDTRPSCDALVSLAGFNMTRSMSPSIQRYMAAAAIPSDSGAGVCPVGEPRP